MNDESRKADMKSRASAQDPFSRERASFKGLLLSNPNYFGNLEQSPLPPVFKISGNTFYEEIACVGYQPQQEYLEAVVYVYQPSGYGTDICGPGTPEYVRFYFFNGLGWDDLGVTSFQVYNVTEGTKGENFLEYAASLKIDPSRIFCFFGPQIKRVRAILSWNNQPPPNQPNWIPIWGNVMEADVLIEPRRIIFWPDLFKAAKIELPPVFEEVVDLDLPIKTTAKSLGAAELATLYRGQEVPAHRFAHKELMSFATSQTNLSAEEFTKFLPDIQLGPDIFDILFPKDGNTSFEELKCIGLDPNQPDTLVGVIQVKLSSGYSGGLCTNGSQEYVTFWGDFDGNGTFETCLGTAQVQVYDIPNLPQDGLYFAARLPVDLNEYRQKCEDGPRVVPIRAILSWNVPAPCGNPNHVPTWGNREETLINIAPGFSAPAGKIAILGGIPVSMIYDAGAMVSGQLVEGLTTPDAVFATNNNPPDSLGRTCPFGGKVTVQGAPLPGFSYKVEVTPTGGGAPTPLVSDLIVTRFDGTTFTHSANVTTGRFDYLNFAQNVNGLMAQWPSSGDDSWVVTLSVYNGTAGNALAALIGTDSHVIQLDNTAPDASITITTGTGDCGKFPSGTLLGGTFVAREIIAGNDYLGRYSLGVEPALSPSGVLSPTSGVDSTPPAPDGWTLDTTGMQACGYVIRVVAVDRAIRNSQSVGHQSTDSAGFCLEEPIIS